MKALIFMDVDGVINDLIMLRSLRGAQPPITHDIFTSMAQDGFEYTIYAPKYLPPLFQKLTEVAEVVWLTTWRGAANEEIREWLGIDALKALDCPPKLSEHPTEWKWRCAAPSAMQAKADDRSVFWVEDFGADIQARWATEAGVRCLDTSLSGYVLQEDNLRELIAKCEELNAS